MCYCGEAEDGFDRIWRCRTSCTCWAIAIFIAFVLAHRRAAVGAGYVRCCALRCLLSLERACVSRAVRQGGRARERSPRPADAPRTGGRPARGGWRDASRERAARRLACHAMCIFMLSELCGGVDE